MSRKEANSKVWKNYIAYRVKTYLNKSMGEAIKKKMVEVQETSYPMIRNVSENFRNY